MKKEIEWYPQPQEYAIGFVEFLGCKIDLSSRPLIPRPETEFWVEKAIEVIHHNIHGRGKYDVRVLDMFAGSGCIGMAVLKHVKNAKVTFADKYKYFDSPNFIKSDVFSNIRDKYDFIFANPPYIPTKNKSKVGKSVLKYEPKTALFGGPDGLFYIDKFLRGVKKHLNTNGQIFMEFSPEQKTAVGKLTKKYGYKNYEFHKDQFNRWRWVSIFN
ncbi:MAG: HemK family protein methyltransferase [Candidatus Staskawiczbacteria bacterium]|nr:HemK family protein methyltransferase [Candidatus Staskawiczbacteria bacterium]